MNTIKNKTRKPLSVPLPRGKRLFLGPGKSGQIAFKDADHPPVAALVEAGDLEIVGEGGSPAGHDRDGGGSSRPGKGQKRGKEIFRSGDG